MSLFSRTSLSVRTRLMGRRHFSAGLPKTEISQLSNGLRVASQTIPNSAAATVGLWIETGSRYEAAADSGVANFAEHLFFGGTAKRSRKNLEAEIGNRGAILNACTSREQTVFSARTLEKDVPWSVELLSESLQNTNFTAESIDRERNSILRALHDSEVQGGESAVFDRLHQTAFRGSPLSRSVLGSAEQVEKINAEQIQKYTSTNYTAPRIVLAGAGAVNHQQLVQLAEKHFGSLSKSEGATPEPAHYVGSSIMVRDDDYEELHLAYGFRTAGWSDADQFPLLVIQHYLGSWNASCPQGVFSSSPLVSRLAEHSLATSVTTFNKQYSDAGLFGVYFVSHQPTWTGPIMEHVQDTLSYLAIHVDPALLEQAKRNALKAVLSNYGSSCALSCDIGRQVLSHGRHLDSREVRARIEAVDSCAVKDVANRFFWDQDFALAAIGPTHGVQDYPVLRSRTYLSRF